MKITQLTHHDLDGYGASTVVGCHADVARIVHVSRYSDVGPVVAAELKRMTRADEPELLLMTDLGLEAVAVTFIKSFLAMNAKRPADQRHRLLVLDHHASSIDQLAAQGFLLSAETDPAWPALQRVMTDDDAVVVMIDGSRCATKLAYDHRDLYASRPPAPAAAIEALVEAIDAVDLWQKDRPIFRRALVLDEVFWDNVSGFIPLDHPWHDLFMSRLLLAMAVLVGRGAEPAEIEREVGAARGQVIDTLLEGEAGDDPRQTSRMRIAPILARAPELFHRFKSGTKLSFGLDAGTFQRVSDAILSRGDATLVINVQRSGSMSFRSTDQSALEAARKFRGGGHKDAAGGRLVTGAAASLADAVEQVGPILDPPPPDVSKSPFAALQGFKA